MLALLKRLVRNAGPAVAVAVLCILAVDANHFAAAQGRLEAEYTLTLAGLPIGRGTWVIDISADQYTAAATGASTGLMQLFTGVRGTSVSHGFIGGGPPAPTSYAATIDYGRKIDDVHIALAGNNITNYTVDPPVQPHPDRIPVSDTDRRGVIDPLSSTLSRVPGNGDPVSPLACNREASVFDGRVRYDLRSEFKRMETVKAEKGYRGPAVVCAVYFTPISGYVPDRPIIKYLTAQRDAEAWLVPISGTRVLVPYRFSMPTPLGFGVLEATQFMTSAQPRASASVKTQ